MENVVEEQGLLQNSFHTKSSFLFCKKTPDHHKISLFYDGGLKLGHFDIFDNAFSISGIHYAHNFKKSRSCDGLAAKGLL